MRPHVHFFRDRQSRRHVLVDPLRSARSMDGEQQLERLTGVEARTAIHRSRRVLTPGSLSTLGRFLRQRNLWRGSAPPSADQLVQLLLKHAVGRTGRLQLYRQPRARTGARVLPIQWGRQEPLDEAPVPEPTSWFEVGVVDTEGEALAAVPFRVQLSNGSLRHGKTNPAGVARFDGLPGGQGEFSLVFGDDEAPEPDEPEAPTGSEWLELEVHVDGRPCADFPFALQLPGGTALREGHTDAHGFTRQDGLPEGPYELSLSAGDVPDSEDPHGD